MQKTNLIENLATFFSCPFCIQNIALMKYLVSNKICKFMTSMLRRLHQQFFFCSQSTLCFKVARDLHFSRLLLKFMRRQVNFYQQINDQQCRDFTSLIHCYRQCCNLQFLMKFFDKRSNVRD